MSTRARLRHAVLPLLALGLAATAQAQGRGSAAQANLCQLVQAAQNIVRGQIITAVVEPHPQFPNLRTVVITISVSKVLKGGTSGTLTFREFLWDTHEASVLAAYKGSGEVIFFLNPVSPYGLTSPVGLEQGRFRVLRDSKGQRYVVNGRGNTGLFDQVSEQAAQRGVVLSQSGHAMLSSRGGKAPLETFEEAVQALAGAAR